MAYQTIGPIRKRCHPVLEGGQVAPDSITEIADMVLPSQLHFNAGIDHAAHIYRGRIESGCKGLLHILHNEVAGGLEVPVCTKDETIPEEREIRTQVKLLGGFPLQVFIACYRRRIGGLIGIIRCKRIVAILVDGAAVTEST